MTDVWGNARLQSLFQWLQDTRLPAENLGPSLTHENRCTTTDSTIIQGFNLPSGGFFQTGGSSFSSTNSSDSGSVSKTSRFRDFYIIKVSILTISKQTFIFIFQVASSVDSSMSVSRLPLRNQFSELFSVLTQVRF